MIPGLGMFDRTKPLGLKNAVIFILCREWPLSIAQIYKRITRHYGINCSYQAVFKQVKELESSGILVRNGRTYKLNERWLSMVQLFIGEVLEKYKSFPDGMIGMKPRIRSELAVE